jgi:hypothetical protein
MRILTDPRAPATSLSCVPQGPRFAQQRAHRPPRDGVQRAHEPAVRREGRETHHRHTHTQARARALFACRWGHIPARRVARACRYAATRILTDPRAPAPSLSCGPQETRFGQQRARRPPRDGVQRAHEPWVRREGRETHHRHTHTHTQARAQALSSCRWGHIPARRVARACRYAATRILTDARAPASSLSCVPQVPLFVQQQAPSPPRDGVQRAHEPWVRREGRETHHRHTHTHKHGRKLSLHAAGGTYRRVVWHAHAAMLPGASSLTHVPPRPLSRVFRRVLNLHYNELTALPATVFNGLTNLV